MLLYQSAPSVLKPLAGIENPFPTSIFPASSPFSHEFIPKPYLTKRYGVLLFTGLAVKKPVIGTIMGLGPMALDLLPKRSMTFHVQGSQVVKTEAPVFENYSMDADLLAGLNKFPGIFNCQCSWDSYSRISAIFHCSQTNIGIRFQIDRNDDSIQVLLFEHLLIGSQILAIDFGFLPTGFFTD